MPWFAIYEIATGRLESLTTIVAGQLRPELAVKGLGVTPPPDTEMWDESTLIFVPRPARTLVDRLDDFRAELGDVPSRLSVPDNNTVEQAFLTVVGNLRFRGPGEAIDMGNPDG